jgi:hypothetical protein
MHTSDSRAFERLWFSCQDKVGELFIIIGIGFYPNLDTAESYAIVNHKGQHTHVRYHRRLGLNRMDMRMGPLSFEVIEPFKTWKLTLDDNPHGIKYEIYWHDTKRPIFAPMTLGPAQRNTSGRRATNVVGYDSFGAIEGWVEVDGKRFTLSTDKYSGSRDHHWGAHEGVGGPGSAATDGAQRPWDGAAGGERPAAPATHAGQWVEFKDWSIWGLRNLRPLGDPRPGTGTFTVVDRALTFEPDTGIFLGGVITSITESGEEKELHFRRLGHQSAFLRCGAYMGSPDGNFWHGMYPGEDKLFGGTYDVAKVEGKKQLLGLADHHCEVSCGDETTYGILESFDPGLYEACRQQLPGFRLLK